MLLTRAVFAGDALYLGVGNAISVIIWLTALIYWTWSFFYRLEGLQVLVVPTAAALSLLPLAFPPVHPLTNTHLAAFKAHFVISLLAYSLFTIASLHVLMMAVMERRLHRGNLPQFMQNLPPLLTMERLLFRIILAGFVLLTLTLGSGILFSEELFGKPMQFTHKTVFGILSWIIFGALLAGRALYGWRGTSGHALDPGRFPLALSRLHRQQVRPRSLAAALASPRLRGCSLDTAVFATDTDFMIHKLSGDRAWMKFHSLRY